MSCRNNHISGGSGKNDDAQSESVVSHHSARGAGVFYSSEEESDTTLFDDQDDAESTSSIVPTSLHADEGLSHALKDRKGLAAPSGTEVCKQFQHLNPGQCSFKLQLIKNSSTGSLTYCCSKIHCQ